MNRKGPWEGYGRQAKRRLARCLIPAFLCAHIFIKRETSGYEAVLGTREREKRENLWTLQKDSRGVPGTSFRFEPTLEPTSEILENIQYGGSSVVACVVEN